MAQNIFNSVKIVEPKRSMFDLSHDVKLSCNMGEIIPILNMDCLPGDKIKISGETLVRFAPMLAPVMHRINVFIHYFYCPWRILWPNFEKFITGRNLNPQILTVPPAFPVIDWVVEKAVPEVERLGDYLGVPNYTDNGGTEPTFQISAMPFAVYDRIWYDYYRDQNFQFPDSDPWQLDDGINLMAGGADHGFIHNRAWEHDYFTAALPWAQKGPSIEIPMGSNPPNFPGTAVTDTTGAALPGALATDAFGQLVTGVTPMQIHAGTINDLRRAKALQTWLETNARTGTRYKESLQGHWGVDTLDERLQRPEYICGLKTPVVITQVLQTSGDFAGADTPLGTMGGHGAALSEGDEEYYDVKEHGTIMGLLSIMPKTAYQQGLHKSWIKTDAVEFGYPEFAHLGEQSIDLNEIYAFVQPINVGQGDAWGYIPRYSEYKFIGNRTCGDFRTSLNYWTMTRIFTAAPGLDADFIVSDPTHRIFAVTDPTIQKMYVQVQNNITAIRPLPKYGTPGG